MREAAVTLLGRHAASNQTLALRLFNTLAKVRRRGAGPACSSLQPSPASCCCRGTLLPAPLSLTRVPLVWSALRPAVFLHLQASTDPGTSVRKSAIKILWESCIRAPGFARATGERTGCNVAGRACRWLWQGRAARKGRARCGTPATFRPCAWRSRAAMGTAPSPPPQRVMLTLPLTALHPLRCHACCARPPHPQTRARRC